ncbi:hypothetical protein K1T71_001288, partial [Dendrolimus kikuchii]
IEMERAAADMRLWKTTSAVSGALLTTIYCYKNNVSSHSRRRTMRVTSHVRVQH